MQYLSLIHIFLPGIDGLIHISQIADHRIEKPQDVLAIGDVVKVAITDIDFDKKRISLSIRKLLEEDVYKRQVCNQCDVQSFIGAIPGNGRFLYSAVNRFPRSV